MATLSNAWAVGEAGGCVGRRASAAGTWVAFASVLHIVVKSAPGIQGGLWVGRRQQARLLLAGSRAVRRRVCAWAGLPIGALPTIAPVVPTAVIVAGPAVAARAAPAGDLAVALGVVVAGVRHVRLRARPELRLPRPRARPRQNSAADLAVARAGAADDTGHAPTASTMCVAPAVCPLSTSRAPQSPTCTPASINV